jgi:flagellar biosynthetic protein FliR
LITFSAAQLDAWVGGYLLPLTRILGMIAVAPLFNITAVNTTTRLILGLAVALAIVPVLPPMPAIPAGSWVGLAVLAEQLLIGIVIGITLRIAFAAIDFAGALIGLQMGLSFAVFYDPQNTAQTPVLSEFLGLLATLVFLAMNGHLLALSVLAESFKILPVGTAPIAAGGFKALIAWTATLFSAGVLLSLPLVAALLIANIGMGVLSRVAPQLNLFAIGFPVTMMAGFTVLMVSLPYFGTALERLFDQSFVALHAIMHAAGGI